MICDNLLFGLLPPGWCFFPGHVLKTITILFQLLEVFPHSRCECCKHEGRKGGGRRKGEGREEGKEIRKERRRKGGEREEGRGEGGREGKGRKEGGREEGEGG